MKVPEWYAAQESPEAAHKTPLGIMMIPEKTGTSQRCCHDKQVPGHK